jgi:hypothetical protein
MSLASLAPPPLTPAFHPSCPWLDRCTRTLFADGCSACRFNPGAYDSDGLRPDPVAGLHLVAIGFAEAAR